MITTVTPEMQTRQRTGFNYWTIPGKEDPEYIIPETLDDCIKRIFEVSDVELPTRKREIINARHFKRFVLERLTSDGQITYQPRSLGANDDHMMYSSARIARAYGCDHATVLHSAKTTLNLIDTEKDYREKAERVFKKI